MHKLYFEKVGRGKPVVFLHGLWGGGDYFKVLGFKLDGFANYYIDELGFGKSDKPSDVKYALSEHAKQIADVIPDDSTIIAHSFGSLIALTLAKYFPEKVRSLVLISPPLYSNRDEAIKHFSHSLVSNWTINKPFLAMLACKLGCSTNLLSLASVLVAKKEARKFIRGCTQHTWHSFQGTFNNLLIQNTGDYQKVFDSIPTYMIYGSKDKYISQEYLKSLTGQRLKKRIVEDIGHALLFTYARIDEEIKRFLS